MKNIHNSLFSFASGMLSACLIFFAILLPGCTDDSDSVDNPPDDTTQLGDVRVWVTTCNQAYLFKEQSVSFSDDVAPFTILVDTLNRCQQVEGFGAALTGSSAYNLRRMTDSQRTSLLTELFDPVKGIGLSYLRLSIGSSDFSLSLYTYCDYPSIDSFALHPTDLRDLIPVLKEILAINPAIKIMATPWTPPIWMKTSAAWSGGSLIPDFYDEYAEYFVRYIRAMAGEGITIDAISVQNEPMWEFGTPGMKMTWQEQLTFIRDFLGPKFAAEDISTKILIWDHNWDMPDYPISILSDPAAYMYIAGSAFHGYGGEYSAMLSVHNQFPQKGLYFTEISGGGWATDFDDNLKWTIENVFFGTLSCFSKNVLLWNLVLDDNWGPFIQGGCSNCRGVITLNSDGSLTRFNEYYALAHFAKAIRPNAYMLGTTVVGDMSQLADFKYVAAQNPDGSKVVVAMNFSSVGKKLAVRCGSNKFTFTVQPESLVTFMWR